jgi:hypothetical protein
LYIGQGKSYLVPPFANIFSPLKINKYSSNNLKPVKFFLTISFLFISLKLSGFGLMDCWGQETPGGNFMGEAYSGNGVYLTIPKTGDKLLRIKKWYFYHNFIVGEFEENNTLFIIDERTGEQLLFNSREQWIKEIQSRELEPILWTRWYTGNWVEGPSLLVLLLLLSVFYLPITLLFALFFILILMKERIRLSFFLKIFALFFIITAGVFLLLDYFPSSI